ncbi:uncharacterized protein LOC133335378 [Musca vetustissima]|uniref:uncharacterized protein LOC133335378 n=1 Tax=Musca vetustissima TaxID=27455 RepID=UPI002AB67DFB|nr:uncharacterized protein LOC133335378 [Musca vetustissima]
MSNGAVPKIRSLQSTPGSGMLCATTSNKSNSDLFELRPKPKLLCIPEDCQKVLHDLRKTQSLNVPKKIQHAEKSWSVIFEAQTQPRDKRMVV